MPRPVARSRRIAADLERRIAAGEWRPGDQIPSRADLGRQYSVHEQTVRLAVNLLLADGVLESRGRRLRLEVAHPPLMRTYTDPDEPWVGSVETLSCGTVTASDDLAARLGISPGLRVNCETEERADPGGRSAMHVTTWWRGKRRPHVSYTAVVDAVPVSVEQAEALRLPVDTIVLRVVRTRLDGGGVPTETADVILPRDRWRLRLR